MIHQNSWKKTSAFLKTLSRHSKRTSGNTGLFGMPYLINVKRLTWVCGHVNPILELSESMLLFKKKKKNMKGSFSLLPSRMFFFTSKPWSVFIFRLVHSLSGLFCETSSTLILSLWIQFFSRSSFHENLNKPMASMSYLPRIKPQLNTQ